MFLLEADGDGGSGLNDLALLLWGGGISLLTAVVTTALSYLISSLKDKEERRNQIADAGRERAEALVGPILELRDFIVRRRPDHGQESFDLDTEALHKIRAAAELLPEKSVRTAIRDSFNMLAGGLRGARHELTDACYVVERRVIIHAYEVLTCYLRHDPIPAKSVKYIADTKRVVDESWKEAAERGEATEL